jgi:hypothetical protein
MYLIVKPAAGCQFSPCHASLREISRDVVRESFAYLAVGRVKAAHFSPRSRRITIDGTNTGSLFIAMELRMKMTRDGQRRASQACHDGRCMVIRHTAPPHMSSVGG